MNHGALDKIFGRQGGRRVADGALIAGIDDVATVLAICPHGHLQWLAERDYEEPRLLDGRRVQRSTVGAPCLADGHRTRRAAGAEVASPLTVIRTVHVPPDACPCGSAA